MKSLVKKLKNNKGESLTETLLAILVVGIASPMLFAMVSSSVSIVGTTKARYHEIFAEISAMAQPSGSSSEGTVTVKCTDTPGSSNSFKVDIYSTDPSGIKCYR